MKLEFFPTDFEKSSNIKFMNIRPVGAELLRVDGHDEPTSRVS